jgi:hypothetical protein
VHYFGIQALKDGKREKVQEIKRAEPILQPFLDPQDKNSFSVPRKRFLPALQAYYAHIGVPLLLQEKNEIIRHFTNPGKSTAYSTNRYAFNDILMFPQHEGTGDMNVRMLEAYLQMHKLPCRKHGRVICGVCSYFRECTLTDCSCTLFK